MSIKELEKENADLRARITSLRGQLPPSTFEDHYTLEQFAERVGMTNADTEKLFAKCERVTDGAGRTCFAAHDVEQALAQFADGKTPGGFI